MVTSELKEFTDGDITSPPFVNRVQSTFCQSSPVHLLSVQSSPRFVICHVRLLILLSGCGSLFIQQLILHIPKWRVYCFSASVHLHLNQSHLAMQPSSVNITGLFDVNCLFQS